MRGTKRKKSNRHLGDMRVYGRHQSPLYWCRLGAQRLLTEFLLPRNHLLTPADTAAVPCGPQHPP